MDCSYCAILTPAGILKDNEVKTTERPMTRGAQATTADGPDVGVRHDACQEGYFGGYRILVTGLDVDRRGILAVGASNVISMTSF